MLRTNLSGLVEDSEPVAGNENCCMTCASLAIRRRVLDLADCVLRQCCELEQAIVGRDCEDHSALRRIVAQCSRGHVRTAELADAEQTEIRASVDVV